MAPRQDQQLEKLLDDALKHSRFQALEDFLKDKNKGTPLKCSKQFITKLDKFMNRELDQKHIKNACLGFTILHTFGQCLVFPGGEGLAGMVSQGLVDKIKWFQKARHLWLEDGIQVDGRLWQLADNLFGALMAILDSGKEGTYQVTESFLTPIGKLVSDSQVCISAQKEAVQTLNDILGAMPRELKEKILSKEFSDVIKGLAGRLVECGDYHMQAAMLEAICRMTNASQRRELVHNWFTMGFVASAFLKIRESSYFDTDCRKFLNMVNGMKGDERRVYSYPCLEVFLDKHELLMPVDENLEEYWIDFNLGSMSMSFYCTLASGALNWESICLPDYEVKSYSVEGQGTKKVLSVLLSSPCCLKDISGSRVSFHFSSSLDILQAAQKVYGSAKGKKFVGKKGTSVVKTTVQIILDDETTSQVSVPKSQVSSTIHKALPPSVPVENSNTIHHLPKSVTPASLKISKSSVFISSSSGRKLGEGPCSAVLPSLTPKRKVKPALQMVSSVERKCGPSLRALVAAKTSGSTKLPPELPDTGKEQQSSLPPVLSPSTGPRPNVKRGHEAEKFHRRNIPMDKVLEMVQTEEDCAEEPLDESIVLDTQPTNIKEGSMFPDLWTCGFSKLKGSVSETVVSRQRVDSSLAASRPDPAPKPLPSIQQEPQQWRPPSAQRGSREVSQRELHSQVTQKLEDLLRERERSLTPGSKRVPVQTPNGGPRKARDVTVPTPESPKPTPTKTLSEKTTNSKAKVSPSDIPKEKPGRGSAAKKTKSEQVTTNMLKLISSHYQGTSSVTTKDSGSLLANATKKRSIFDKAWSLTSGVKGDLNSSGFLKPFETSKMDNLKEDVYAFEMDSPGVIGKNTRMIPDISLRNSSATGSSSARSASEKKAPPAKVFSRHVKKHLFSDTDTDRDRDEASDISWLKDSARKPKPKVANYSRKPKVADYSHKPAKACPPPCTMDPPAPAPPPPKPMKEKAKPTRKRPQKKPVEQKAAPRPSAAATETGRRPRRAAAMDVSYREVSDQSESEEPPALPTKKRRTADPADVTERPQPEVPKAKKASPPPEKLVRPPPESWVSRVASTRLSPPSVERMRSAEKSPPTALSPTTPLPPLCLSPVARPSPSPTLPKPMMGIQASSFYKPATGGKDKNKLRTPSLPALPTPISRAPSIASCRRSHASEHPQLSPVHSLPSPAQPLLTSTALEKSPEGSPLKSTNLDQQLRDFVRAHSDTQGTSDKDSVISLVTLSQSPQLSVNNVAMLCTEIEKTPASNRGHENSKQVLQSGPSYDPTCHSSQSNSSHTDKEREDEDEEEEEEDVRRAPREKPLKMKPRQLFREKKKAWLKHPEKKQSCSEEDEESEEEDEEEQEKMQSVQEQKRRRTVKTTKTFYSNKNESTSTVENMEVGVSSHVVSRSSSTWTTGRGGKMDVDVDAVHLEMNASQEMGYICQEFSTELGRKFQKRSERMELYTKQSLKTVQQHMSSVRLQMRKTRTQRLEKIKQALLEEISNLEQDDRALKSMESELTIYWRKQSLALHSYQERESQRLQHLKNTFQTNVFHSMEYEEQIFSSEMCLMRKDMNSVQDKFLQEMQEEELSSMRRGLQTLFPSGARGLF